MNPKSVAFIKACVFFFNFSISVTGAVIVAASVRVLIDPDFSHLLFQGNGNHSTSGHVLIATGAVMILVGLIGCVGAWRESPFLLGSFLFFVVLFIVAEIGIGFYGYAKTADFYEKVHFNIFWAVERYYGNDVINTTLLDFLQQGWKCCGLNSYTSWSNSMYSKRLVPKGGKSTNLFIVPKSCCMDPKSDPCEQIHLKGVLGTVDPVAHILHSEGCGPKLMASLHMYTKYVLIFGVTILVVQLVASAFSLFFIYSIKCGHSIRFKWIKTGNPRDPALSKMGSPCSAPSFDASRSSLAMIDAPISSLV